MAQLPLSKSRWRMLRRVLKKKRFRYADARNMARHHQEQFDWLVANGFVAVVGDEVFEVTDRRKAAADLGMYELRETDPSPAPARSPGPQGGGR
jgi:hypothetical protein